MPPVSEKQRRAMWAAAKGQSTLGIPKSVGKEYVAADAEEPRAAGVLCLTEGQNPLALFILRAGDRVWELPGGTAEQGEKPSQTAAREALEETGLQFDPESLEPIHATTRGTNYVTHLAGVKEAVVPKLSAEHIGHAWAPLSMTPEPLRPEVRSLLDVLSTKTAEDIALDEASVRRVDDKTGHMHVAMTPISKADVNPYTGKEINGVMAGNPDWKPLPEDKLFNLLRDPDELAKAAESFAGKPLLIIHKPVSSMDHPHRITVGSVGTEIKFDPPYLMAPLAVWDAAAIALIESGEQKELSSGYHYTVDMTPGNFNGKAFDGVMRDIRGNHVALVREGRAGSDVAVGDSMENVTMTKQILSRKAALLQGALIATFPKIAMDAKVDLPKALVGLTSKNFATKKASVLETLRSQFKASGIAQDADLGGIARLIDAVEGAKVEEDEEDPESEVKDPEAVVAEQDNPMAAEDPDDVVDAGADEGGLADKIKALLEGAVPPEKLAEIEQVIAAHEGEEAATGEPAEDDDLAGAGALGTEPNSAAMATGDRRVAKDRKIGKDARMAKDNKGAAAPVSKPAMDQAINSAVSAARKQMQEVRDAERFVRPIIGDLAVACDSAGEVYKLALDHYGIDVTGVHPSAYRTLLDVRMSAEKQLKVPAEERIAQDEASAKTVSERFKGLNRIRVVA